LVLPTVPHDVLEVVVMAELTLRHTSEYIMVADDRDLRTVIGGSDERWPGVVVPNANLSLEIGGQEVAWLNINRTAAQAVAGETFDGETLSTPSGDIFRVVSDRLKWDVEFDEHPGVYAWAFAIRDSGNLSYHRQPPLTAGEIAAGHERPDDVVGSYAIYMDRMHNAYGTGKFAHIYRPLFIAADGDEAWGTLDISGGVMTIGIDQEWMDNAVYPVRLDPTIGYSSIGSGSMAASSAYRAILATDMYTASAGDIVTAIHMGLRTYFTGTIPVGVFDIADLSRLVEAHPYANSTTSQFWTVDGLSAPMTAGHQYCMAVGANSQLQQKYDVVTDACRIGTYGDPWVDGTQYDYRLSMYADVEPGGGEPVNFDEALSVSGGGDCPLTARVGFQDGLFVTGGGAAELSAVVGYLDSLAAPGGGSTALTARIGVQDVQSISGGGAAELSAVVGFFEALAVSGGGSATISIEGDTAVIREVIRLAGNRNLNIQLAGDRRLVITLTGNIGD